MSKIGLTLVRRFCSGCFLYGIKGQCPNEEEHKKTDTYI